MPGTGPHPVGITADQIEFIRRLRAQRRTGSQWLTLGAVAISMVLIVGAFLLGRATAPNVPPKQAAPRTAAFEKSAAPSDVAGITLHDGILSLIDEAMASERSHNYLLAIERLERAQHDAGHIYGMNYQLASLCYKANDMGRVLPLLNLSIAEGEEVAACYSLRGIFSNQYNRTDRGPGDLEKATLLDPFDAHHLFVWGEALRRAGKPQAALLQLSRALNRLQEPALESSWALKIRLTQIELGQEELFATELAARLKSDPAPVDWLLTAAAVEMRHSNFPAAAEYLRKVRALIGQSELAARLQDIFFTNFALEQELEKFFVSSTTVTP